MTSSPPDGPPTAIRHARRAVLLLLAGGALAACGRPVVYSKPEAGFLVYRAEDVLRAFAAAGLQATAVSPRPIATATPNPDLPRQPRVRAGGPPTEPMVEVEAFTFVIPSLGQKGGRIFIFDSPERLRAKQIWYARFPDLYPHVFTHANVLIWLDGALPAAEAARYQAALETLR